MKTLSYIFILFFSLVALSAFPTQGERSKKRGLQESQAEVLQTVENRLEEIGVDTETKVLKTRTSSVESLSPQSKRVENLVVTTKNIKEKCKEIQNLLEEYNER
jgi:hypothetical protein